MIKVRFLACALLLCCLALVARAQTKPAVPAIPHLEKRGQATQLIVDGKPFLVLGGELSNTVSSDTERMKVVWPLLSGKVHMNTILTGVSWDWIEPEEGSTISAWWTSSSKAPARITCISSGSGSAVGRTGSPASLPPGSRRSEEHTSE